MNLPFEEGDIEQLDLFQEILNKCYEKCPQSIRQSKKLLLKGKYFCHDLKRIDLIKKQKYVQGAPKKIGNSQSSLLSKRLKLGKNGQFLENRLPLKFNMKPPFRS